MAMASISIRSSSSAMKMTIPSSQNKHLFAGHPSSYISLPRPPLSRSVISLARRRSNSPRPISSSNNNKKKSHKKQDSDKDEDLDEDAFEALFKQLEEDLKKDEQLMDDGEDEISEEDLALLERELEEALAEDEDLTELLNVMTNDAMGKGGDEEEEEEEESLEDDDGGEDEEEEEEEEDDEDEEEPVKLKGWQLRRLAYALKVGRRKTSIKNLAAELCLDRAIVLELLRDPPPDLVMLSASLPDKQKPTITNPESETTESTPSDELVVESVKPDDPKVKTPIHELQGSWSAKKRIKKAHVNTLESVYRRTKRPTNAMISSIIQVTNLPRRRVVKWFEDKRAADGVPEQRHPFQRSSSQSVFAQ